MSIMHDNIIEQLLQCYTEELAHYQQICTLAAMQQELCVREDLTEAAAWEKFAGILSQRRSELTLVAGKIEQRQTIEANLAQQLGLSQWNGGSLASALLAQAPCAAARRLCALLPQLAALLQQINALDRQSKQHLETAREQLKGKMAQLRSGKRAKGAYGSQSRQKEGYFVENNR